VPKLKKSLSSLGHPPRKRLKLGWRVRIVEIYEDATTTCTGTEIYRRGYDLTDIPMRFAKGKRSSAFLSLAARYSNIFVSRFNRCFHSVFRPSVRLSFAHSARVTRPAPQFLTFSSLRHLPLKFHQLFALSFTTESLLHILDAFLRVSRSLNYHQPIGDCLSLLDASIRPEARIISIYLRHPCLAVWWGLGDSGLGEDTGN
jgi:hypothetical protein